MVEKEITLKDFYKEFCDFRDKSITKHLRAESVQQDFKERFIRIEANQMLFEKKLNLLNEGFDVLDKRTARLPDLYDAVDSFMSEIIESRQERTFLNNRVTRLEETAFPPPASAAA